METTFGYWYGHYDSRGGSTLITGAKSEEEALKYYVEEAFCTEPSDEWYENYLRNLKEELMRTIVVKIFDKIEPGHDLIYGKEELAWGLVPSTIELDESDFPLVPCKEVDSLDLIQEIWICKEGSQTPPEGYKLCSLGFAGEDAYGLIWEEI